MTHPGSFEMKSYSARQCGVTVGPPAAGTDLLFTTVCTCCCGSCCCCCCNCNCRKIRTSSAVRTGCGGCDGPIGVFMLFVWLMCCWLVGGVPVITFSIFCAIVCCLPLIANTVANLALLIWLWDAFFMPSNIRINSTFGGSSSILISTSTRHSGQRNSVWLATMTCTGREYTQKMG